MFILNHSGAVSYYTVPMFEDTGLVRHCISTREGGVSKGCYSSMSLRFNCDDEHDNVVENFRRIADTIGVDHRKMVLSKQVHEDLVRTVDDAYAGNGIVRENVFESADGLMTDKPGICLVTLYADCVPLMFLDPVKRVIATSHSGWKGTVKRIGAKTVRKMINDFGSRPEDILCAIGPSIQAEHFEVGDDVAQIFIDSFGADTAPKYGDRYHVDMQKAIEKQLKGEGIVPEHIDNCGICTYCSSNLLFSHRKTNGRRGNFGAFIALRGD